VSNSFLLKRDLVQSLTSMVKTNVDPNAQGRASEPKEMASKPDLNSELRAHEDSALRRCQQMITSVVNEALKQSDLTSEARREPMQGTEQTCRGCRQLEERIQMLEQQKRDEEAGFVARMEKLVEQMVEKRMGHPLPDTESGATSLPRKRRRLDEPPASTPLVVGGDGSAGKSETRPAKPEGTVSVSEKRLMDGPATGADPARKTDATLDSIVGRVDVLEDDSKQVTTYVVIFASKDGLIRFARSSAIFPFITQPLLGLPPHFLWTLRNRSVRGFIAT